MRSRINIRPPAPDDMVAFLAAARRSRTLHGRWVRAPDTPAKFRAYLKKMAAPNNQAFLVCIADTGEPAGVINLTNVVMGPLRSGYLGYYVFAGLEGRGLMREGMNAVVRQAFRKLGLHRLEANIQPDNIASIALAKSCGFSREGFSPRYLKIGGRWRDHERWAIVAS